MDLKKLHDEFMAESRYSSRFSPVTLKNYESTFSLFIKLEPDTTLSTLTSGTIISFFKKLETRERIVGRGKIKKGIKSTTIATYRAKLAPFFNWLKQKGHIQKSPFDDLPAPQLIYDEPKYLRKEQVEKIFTAIDFTIDWNSPFVQKRNMAIITTLLFTGIRKGELLGLKTTDLDLERGEIKIEALTSKSKQYKTLPINSLLRRKLADYFEERKRRKYTTPQLFASETSDTGLTAQGLKHLIKRINDVSGVKFHLHQLRHTFAVNLIGTGTDVSVVQKLMGHKTISSTLTYLRCIPNATMRQGVESLRFENLV